MKASIIIPFWVVAILAGLFSLYRYELTPGVIIDPSPRWHDSSSIKRGVHPFLLLIFLHPHCPCSRASLRELESIVSKTQGRLEVDAIFILPSSQANTWVKSDLWDQAKAIPGLKLQVDYDGAEAKRFGSTTSGQVFLYNKEGDLLFMGGITGSRGHEGSNYGSDSIINIVMGESCKTDNTLFFGCPLFNE